MQGGCNVPFEVGTRKNTLVPLDSVPLISAIPLISTQFVRDQYFYLAKPLISATSH